MKKQPNLDVYFYITGWVVIAMVALVFLLSAALKTPLTELFPPCPLNKVTGYYCPGCGGTRAMLSLLQGKIVLSAFYYPFVPFAVIGGLWFMLSQTINRICHGRFKAVMHMRMLYCYIAIALILINCIIKNAFILFANIDLLDYYFPY